MSEVQIQSLKPRHEAIIDWLLANPGARNLTPLCAKLSISRSWLSIVMRSDCFREEYTRRRQDHSQELSRQLIEKQLKVTLKALDRVDEVLDDPDEYDGRLALDIADRLSRSVFGTRPGGAPVVEEERTREVRTVDAGVLREARETIRRVTHAPVSLTED